MWRFENFLSANRVYYHIVVSNNVRQSNTAILNAWMAAWAPRSIDAAPRASSHNFYSVFINSYRFEQHLLSFQILLWSTKILPIDGRSILTCHFTSTQILMSRYHYVVEITMFSVAILLKILPSIWLWKHDAKYSNSLTAFILNTSNKNLIKLQTHFED